MRPENVLSSVPLTAMLTQKIFFSYSRLDSAFALKLAQDIRDAGADIWIDQLDIQAGNHWDSAVEQALTTSVCVLVILTPASTSSTNVMDEVSFALESGKKIIPVLLEDCLPPFRLRRLQRIDFTKDYHAGLTQLLASFNLTPAQVSKAIAIAEENAVESDSIAGAVDDAEQESRLWNAACKLNTIAGYEKYLAETGTGEFSAEARIHIAQLTEELKEDELEATVWKKAKSDHTLEGYRSYLKTYPDRNYRSLAQAAIAELEAQQKEEQVKLDLQRSEAKQLEAKRLAEQQAEQKRLEEKRLEEKRAEEKRQEEKRAEEKRLEEKRREEQRILDEKKKEEQRILEAKKKEEQRILEEKKRVEQRILEEKKREEQRLQEEKLKEEKRLNEERKKEERRIEEQKKEQKRQEALRLEEERKAKKEEEKQKKRAAQTAAVSAGGEAPPASSPKKWIFIGGGILILGLVIWMVSGSGSKSKKDEETWKMALMDDDSSSYAGYLVAFPKGKYFQSAKQKLDSLYQQQLALQQSLAIARERAIKDSTDLAKANTDSKASKTKPTTPAPPTTNKTKPPTASKVKSPYTLGQVFGGGIIIHIDATGLHGLILSDKELGAQNYDAAMKKCTNFKGSGYYDWRLPTKDELGKIYAFRKEAGLFAKGAYWSATLDKGSNAWALNMYDGKPGTFSKEMSYYVRAVRAF